MRFPKPFFRHSKDAWYLQIGKRQISLGRNREEAFRRYQEISLHELGCIATPKQSSKATKLIDLFDLFLEWAQKHTESYDWYRHFLQKFASKYGQLSLHELKPFHVTRWLSAYTWGSTTQNKAISILKRGLNWALEQGLITANPLAKLKKPRENRRSRILEPHEHNLIMGEVKDEAFRQYLTALYETGARPGEIAKITATDVNQEKGIWVLDKHKTWKHTGKPRIIYLNDAMRHLSISLCDKYPSGTLFRNSRGVAWSKNAIRIRFRNLRKKLPQLKGVVAYTYRHTFTTEALQNGVGVAQVAELLGHTSTDTVMHHYQHLSERQDYLRRMAEMARRPVPTAS